MACMRNAEMPAGRLESILYVEDDVNLRTTTRLVLEVIGRFEVLDCSSGTDALLAAGRFRPDLLLLHTRMPALDGLALLASLRAMPHLADTPVIFVTAPGAGEDHGRYLDAGALGVIAKPRVPLRLTEQLLSMWAARSPASA